MANKLNTTPAGIAVYPHLHLPDTKYDDAGVYTSKLRFKLADDGVSKLMDLINDEMAVSLVEALEKWETAVKEETDAKKKRKLKAKPPVAADPPFDLDEDDGTVEVNFKMKASGVSRKDGRKWKRRPRVYDANLQVVPAGTKVGGGSTLKVGFNVNRFWTTLIGAGVSLQLEAVQILELKQFTGASAEDAGFEVADGGFSAADLTEDDVVGTAAPEEPTAGESDGAEDKNADLSDF